MVIFYTHMGPSSIYLVIAVNVIMFTGVFSRMIPASAMTSAIPDPAHRGSFMAINSSMQQISGGIGSLIAGAIVVQNSDGRIGNFQYVGYVVVVCSFITWYMLNKIQKRIPERKNEAAHNEPALSH